MTEEPCSSQMVQRNAVAAVLPASKAPRRACNPCSVRPRTRHATQRRSPAHLSAHQACCHIGDRTKDSAVIRLSGKGSRVRSWVRSRMAYLAERALRSPRGCLNVLARHRVVELTELALADACCRAGRSARVEAESLCIDSSTASRDVGLCVHISRAHTLRKI
eukprot:7376256-Prymnesium_polylepis.2